MNNDVINTNYQIGLLFGKFYPLHRGHIYLIEKALSQVDELHIMLGCEDARDKKIFIESNLPKQPSAQDRLFWLKKTFKDRANIHIHMLDEQGIAYYPNGWKDWSDRVKTILLKHGASPTVVFTSEPQDVKNHEFHYQCPVRLIDANRDFISISGTQIRKNPYQHWQQIANAAKPFFVKKVAIIGVSDHFKQLPIQLANIFNTAFVTNGYINYILREQRLKMQKLTESDYLNVALIHNDRIERAAINAERILFTSLDFKTLHQFYNMRFKHSNPILQALEESSPFDLIIHEQELCHLTYLEQFETVTALVDALIK